jgi:arsenate reductase
MEKQELIAGGVWQLNKKSKVLFLCTGNSCRSQMAEGFCRVYHSDRIVPFSAGIVKHGLNQLAVRAMNEISIDISDHFSKTVDDLEEKEFDFVVTVCDDAHEKCPYFPAVTAVIHRGFDDPPRLAAEAATDDEALVYYRRVRDEIKQFVINLPSVLLG